MANFARGVSVRLGLFQGRLNFALRQISASVLVVFLAGLGDVNGGGLRVLSDLYGRLLGNDVLGWRNEQEGCEQNE